MAPSNKHAPKSPFLAPRRSSSYGGGSDLDNTPSPHTHPTASISSDKYNLEVEPEHKSTLAGCTANLITAIVGAGIIGIPYAMKETGLVAGWALILLSGILGSKSLRLLVETAKHVDAESYEVLCETVFGNAGWYLCNIMMFCMSWGPMLSYLMLVKDTLGQLLGYDGSICLIVSSMFIMLPISLQRDMADLAKTSRISVLFNIGLVAIIAKYSPTDESISVAGGLTVILSQSTIRPRTLAIGLGIISFAFSCQHSSLIIATSLNNPTRERWSKVSYAALLFCSVLSIIMGSYGYIGFRENVQGNILKNFPSYESASTLTVARAGNVARSLVCGTMCFVYPLESYVCRHVIMTNLFQGREAHAGVDAVVLDRWDRRAIVTIVLYLSALLPALKCDDVGLVLSLTGTVAATTLTYIMPGMLFLGVHGQTFLDLVESRWGPEDRPWYLLIPVWCKLASSGKRGVAYYMAKKEMMTPYEPLRLGKVKHKRDIIMQRKRGRSEDKLLSEGIECTYDNESPQKEIEKTLSSELGLITATFSGEESQHYGSVSSNTPHVFNELVEAENGEEDPQDEKQTAADFLVAISFVVFGVIAFSSGIISIYNSG